MTEPNQKPKIMVENVSCVLPEQSGLGALFLGNVYGAQNATILKEYGIRAVLTSSIQTDINFSFKDIPFHLKIQAHDKQNYNIKEHINKCIDFIEKARQMTNVYVHCFAGVSRSVAIVCAYIMWKMKWNYETTIAFVKAKRIVAKPNEGFVRQLLEIQQILFEGSSILLSQNSKIESFHTNNSQQIYNHPTTTTQTLQAFDNTKVEPNLSRSTKKQNLTKQRVSSSSTSSNGQYAQNKSQQFIANAQHYKVHPQQFQVDKQFHLKERSRYSNQYANSQDQTNYKNVQHQQKPQANDKFLYLQNFFPQNHSDKIKSNQFDLKSPQHNVKLSQNEVKQRNNFSVTSSGENWFVRQKKDQLTTQTSNSGLRKVDNFHGLSPKNFSHNQPQKPLSSTNQLTLGGKKNNYNHNSIPVPRVSQRKQIQKTSHNQGRVSEYVTSTDKYAGTMAQSNHHYQRASQGVTMTPQVNEYIWATSQQKFKSENKFANQGPKSPVSDSIYNRKFDFRSSAPSDGFYNSGTSAQKKQAQKSTSRVLVRPKDLPGYKNY